MINSRSALRARFTIAVVVISLFSLLGCEIQDLGITESAAPPQDEVSLSVSSQSSVPANPPAWSATALYNRAGMYVTHNGKVWVSQWYITLGAEPGANTWNGWKQATPPPKWTDVSISASYSFAINEKGELYGWGSNAQGRLGDGTTTDRRTPSRIGTASDWVQISAGSNFSLGINTKGELYAWGRNYYGQLGDGTRTNRNTPTRIGTASDWVRISAGLNHSVAVNSKGELYAWGHNNYGRLGDGTVIDRNSPTRIGTAADWKSVSGRGSHNLAINTKGEIYAWGRNNDGQVGDGTTIDRSSPVKTAHP